MITLDDCVALCGLTNDEVTRLRSTNTFPEMTAAALGQCLLTQPGGCQIIRDMIADDVRWARQRGDERHADEHALTFKQFVSSHPEIGDQSTTH